MVEYNPKGELPVYEDITEEEKAIVKLYCNGYNYQEISQEMGLSVSAVKMQIKRSMELLRTALSM